MIYVKDGDKTLEYVTLGEMDDAEMEIYDGPYESVVL